MHDKQYRNRFISDSNWIEVAVVINMSSNKCEVRFPNYTI